MKRIGKRITSAALVLCMTVSQLSALAYASDEAVVENIVESAPTAEAPIAPAPETPVAPAPEAPAPEQEIAPQNVEEVEKKEEKAQITGETGRFEAVIGDETYDAYCMEYAKPVPGYVANDHPVVNYVKKDNFDDFIRDDR